MWAQALNRLLTKDVCMANKHVKWSTSLKKYNGNAKNLLEWLKYWREKKKNPNKTKHWQWWGAMGILIHEWEMQNGIVSMENSLAVYNSAYTYHTRLSCYIFPRYMETYVHTKIHM